MVKTRCWWWGRQLGHRHDDEWIPPLRRLIELKTSRRSTIVTLQATWRTQLTALDDQQVVFETVISLSVLCQVRRLAQLPTHKRATNLHKHCNREVLTRCSFAKFGLPSGFLPIKTLEYSGAVVYPRWRFSGGPLWWEMSDIRTRVQLWCCSFRSTPYWKSPIGALAKKIEL